MSEERIQHENGTTATEEKKREPFKIELEKTEFKSDADAKYITSIELCNLAKSVFGSIFGDYYGSTFEINQGYPMMTLCFSHIDDRSTDKILATQRSSTKTVGSKLIDSTRAKDNLMKNGDRYVLTDDAKDAIFPILMYKYKRGGFDKVNWNNMCTECVDNYQVSAFSTGRGVPYTKVAGIDPQLLAALIWGEKDEDGAIDYGITVLKNVSMNSMGFPGQTPNNFILLITRSHNKTVQKTFEKLGLGYTGSNIIR